MQHIDFLKRLNNKALFPYEKLDSNDPSTSIENSVNANYINLLKKSICKNGSEESFEKYCSLNGLQPDDIDILCSSDFDVELQPQEWINMLNASLEQIDLRIISFEPETKRYPFYQLLTPFVEFSFTVFLKRLSEKSIEHPTQEITQQLKNALYRELCILSYDTLYKDFLMFLAFNQIGKSDDDESFYYKRFVIKNLKEKLETIFLKTPVLARLIATKMYRYAIFMTNLFERFTKDKGQIEKTFKVELADLKKVHLNAGDLHHGETTAIFEFSDSYKLVYKPTNLQITSAYNDLLDWINKNLHENLRSFEVLDKSHYGWIEFVKAEECETVADVQLYYERAGMLSVVAYFLNSRDYHYENVIASGNCPVLIDHETIIGPQVRQLLEDRESTVINTILESMLLPSPDAEITRKCGFGSIQQQNRQAPLVHKIANCNEDAMKKVQKPVGTRTDLNHIPKLDGELQFIENYPSEFFKGLYKMYHLILENKTFLTSKESPLKGFEKAKVRHIVRPTRVYGKILSALNNSKYLRDAALYGLKIEMLARTYLLYDNLSVDILKSEREQMSMGDIPVFYTTATSRYVELDHGKKAHVFEKSAVESIQEKIQQASTEDLEYQVGLVKDVFLQP